MSFLHPVFLFLLAAAGVPLVIHLLNRRRIPERPFGSLRFLRPSEKRSMRRVDLRRLLLLLLRMAAIALFALAVARPVVRGGLASLFPASSPRAVVLLVDRSWSMGASTGEGTAMDEAARRATSVLDHLEQGDELTVIFFDERPATVLAGAAFDRAAALDALAEPVPSWRTTDLRGAVDAALEILGRSPLQARELFIVSDFQRGVLGAGSGRGGGLRAGTTTGAPAVGDAGAAANAGEADPGPPGPVRAFLLPVGGAETGNTAIERIDTPRAVLHRGEAVAIDVHLRDTGGGTVRPLRIVVDGRRIAERETAVPAGGRRIERFLFPAEQAGRLRCEASTTPDRLPADDTRRFVLDVRERLTALLVADDDPYLEEAIAPGGKEGDLALERRDWRGFESADLDVDAAVLGSGRGPLDADLPLIERFVEQGGRLLVFVLPETEPVVRRLSGARLEIEFRDPGGGARSVEPVPGATLLAPFDREDLEALSRLRLRGGAAVRGVSPGSVELGYADGTPLVWRERRGNGEVVFVAVEPNNQALVLSPWFLPLVQQALLSATGGAPGGEVLVGEPIGRVADAGTVLLPGGATMRPGPGAPAVAREPGFAEIRTERGVQLVAVNPDCTVEPDLAPLDPRLVADSLGLAHAAVIERGAAPAERLRNAREGRELATPLAAAALVLLVVELAVAQYARRSADVG